MKKFGPIKEKWIRLKLLHRDLHMHAYMIVVENTTQVITKIRWAALVERGLMHISQ